MTATMKAVICNALGPVSNLQISEVPTPDLQPGHVLIDVAVAGINFPDGLIVQGKHISRPATPFVPGIEAAGTVVAIGDGVGGLTPGDRVAVTAAAGALGEKMLAPAVTTYRLPANLPFETAAAALITYGTTYYALKDRAHLRAGETVLVLGAAGGVGLAAVELGKLMGAHVIAVASSPEKLALAAEYGADELINYRENDLRQALRTANGGRGIDIVYDPVGGAASEAAVRAMGWGGRHLVIGFAAGDIPKLPINLFLVKNADLLGVLWGASALNEPRLHTANIEQLMQWCANGMLKPRITGRYPLEQAAEAIEAVMSRAATGKLVVQVSAEPPNLEI